MNTEELIEAANKRAALYTGDDRQDIKTEVITAFYAGAEFGYQKQGTSEEIQRLRNLKMVEAVDIGFVVLKPETYEALKRERDEYAGVLAYYGNSTAIYHDVRNGLYALDTLRKYANTKVSRDDAGSV